MSSSSINEHTEAHNPLPRYTKCIAKCTFNGDSPDDLSFNTGDVLIILQPDKAMFWYFARHSTTGQEGLIPITLTEVVKETEAPPPLPPRPSRRETPNGHPLSPSTRVPHSPSTRVPHSSLSSPPHSIPLSSPPPLPPPNHTHNHAPPSNHAHLPSHIPPPVVGRPIKVDPIDTRPPMPLPPPNNKPSRPTLSPSPNNTTSTSTSNKKTLITGSSTGKYSTIQKFYSSSGWFNPTVDMVLCNKASMSLHAFRKLTSAVYYFQHKFDRTKHFVGKSLQIYSELTQLFSRLYEKSAENLNPLEKELRYHSSDAQQWNFRMWQYSPTELELECAKLIIKQRCLQPHGLNSELRLVSKDDFTKFCIWYTEERRKSKDRLSAS